VKKALTPQDLPGVEIPAKAQRIIVELLLQAVSTSESISPSPNGKAQSEE